MLRGWLFDPFVINKKINLYVCVCTADSFPQQNVTKVVNKNNRTF